MSSSAFTPAVLTVSSGAGSGSGEKNYITNPSAASAITGWGVVGDFTLSRTTAASDLPREYSTATGIKVVATSAVQSTADYIYFDFNLDDVDLGKKLKIQWSQKKIGTYSAGQLAVVITSQADRTTALITPQTTAIPASDLDFVTSFDSTTTAALSLVIRATADMTTGDGIVISDVIVGPGEIVQGAAISEWQTYTPTGAWTSNVTYAGKWRRVGNCMEVSFDASLSGAPNSAAFTINLPTGYTIDTSSLPNTFQTSLTIGSGTVLDSGTRGYPCVVIFTGSSIQMYCAETTGASTSEVTQANPITFGSADNVTGHFTLPITEWSGFGTVNLLNSNVTEANAALVVEGLAAATINSGTAARFNTTKLSRGSVTYSNSTGYFTVPVTDYYQVRAQVFGGFTGTPRAILTNATDNVEIFSGPTGTTGGGESHAFIDCTSLLTAGKSYYIKIFGGPYTYYASDVFANLQVTRVSQYNTSAPVGFGLAGTDGSAGLYKPGSAPGQPNGSTIAAGYIGEQRRVTFSSVTVLTSAMEIARLTNITPGVYVVRHWMDGVQGSSTRFISSYNNGVAIDGSQIGESNFDGALYSTTWVHQGFRYLLVNSTIANYYLVGQASGANITGVRGIFEAIRIS